jgi:voltage-gated potassium channel Kch
LIFLLETILRLIGLGLKGYFKEGSNIFDGLIVILSCTEWMVRFIYMRNGQERSVGLFIVLRCFRMFTIFKIVRSWTSLRSILLTVANALPHVGNLAFLTFLFTFIYALIGKQFFGHKTLLNEDGIESPYSFKTLSNSLITVFILITGENWIEISHVTMNTYGVYAVIYFISAILIGRFMLLNLFLAILLKYISNQIEFEHTEKQIQKELKERKERLIKMASMTKEDFLREAGPHRKKTLDTIMD